MNLYIWLFESKWVTSSNQDLLLNQVDTSDLLSNWMLYLKSSVHFKEIEILVLVHEELDGTCGCVTTGSSQLNCLFTHLVSSSLVHNWAWSFLNNLLVSSLDWAFSFWQVNIVIMLISQDLEFNVSRLFDVLLNEDSSITKWRNSFFSG